ncbi:hypothetical protein AcV5_005365 [Taiwanofungus camphoratus]|nr:hypothetical protein AcV5_005365 [Antrodia cinnamomea]
MTKPPGPLNSHLDTTVTRDPFHTEHPPDPLPRSRTLAYPRAPLAYRDPASQQRVPLRLHSPWCPFHRGAALPGSPQHRPSDVRPPILPVLGRGSRARARSGVRGRIRRARRAGCGMRDAGRGTRDSGRCHRSGSTQGPPNGVENTAPARQGDFGVRTHGKSKQDLSYRTHRRPGPPRARGPRAKGHKGGAPGLKLEGHYATSSRPRPVLSSAVAEPPIQRIDTPSDPSSIRTHGAPVSRLPSQRGSTHTDGRTGGWDHAALRPVILSLICRPVACKYEWRERLRGVRGGRPGPGLGGAPQPGVAVRRAVSALQTARCDNAVSMYRHAYAVLTR